MQLLLFLNLTIIVLIAFFSTHKNLNILENIFLFLFIELIFNSYIAVLYINFSNWEIGASKDSTIIFRLWELVLVPLLYVWYFNFVATFKRKFVKLYITLFFIGSIYMLELLLARLKVITYKNWQPELSILCISLILLLTYFLKHLFHNRLRNEGIAS